jgi:hypothetical protein
MGQLTKMSIVMWVSAIVLCLMQFKLIKADFEDFTENPYRILKMPPWSNTTQIKHKYNQFMKNLTTGKNKNKKENLEEIKKIKSAWETIKKDRAVENEKSLNDNDDQTLGDVVNKTLALIVTTGIIMLMIYVCLYVSFTIYSYIWKFMLIFSCSFVICNRLIPHYFDTLKEELFYSCIFSIGFYVAVSKISKKLLLKKELIKKNEEIEKKNN